MFLYIGIFDWIGCILWCAFCICTVYIGGFFLFCSVVEVFWWKNFNKNGFKTIQLEAQCLIHYILLNEGITINLNLRISILYSKYRSFNNNIESGKWIQFHRKRRSVVTALYLRNITRHPETIRALEPWRGIWNSQISDDY